MTELGSRASGSRSAGFVLSVEPSLADSIHRAAWVGLTRPGVVMTPELGKVEHYPAADAWESGCNGILLIARASVDS